jgi:hypothetical protein
MPIAANDNIDWGAVRALLAFAEQALDFAPGALTITGDDPDALLDQVLALRWVHGVAWTSFFFGELRCCAPMRATGSRIAARPARARARIEAHSMWRARSTISI